MLDRHGQINGPSTLGGLAREAVFFGPLAGRQIVSCLGLAALGLVDGVMLAQHSAGQLAVHGLADAMAGRGLDIGLTVVMASMTLAPVAATAKRGDDQRELGRLWHQALLLALLLGVAGIVLGALAPLLLALFDVPASLADAAEPVIATLSMGLLPALLAVACAGLLQATGRAGVVLLALLGGNVLNLALNLQLIDGPSGAAAGVAIATTVVRWVVALGLLATCWCLPEQARYGLRSHFGSRQWQAGARQRKLGQRLASQAAARALLPAGLVVMASWQTALTLASLTALGLVMVPCLAVSSGLAATARQRVAQVLEDARRRPGSVTRCGERCTALACLIALLFFAAYSASASTLVKAVLPDPVVMAQVLPLLPLALTVAALDGLALLGAALLQGLGEHRRVARLQWLCALPALALAWLLGAEMGGGIAGLLGAMGLAAAAQALAFGRLYRGSAHLLDASAAQAMTAHASAIAHGFADTVMLWPSQAGDASSDRIPHHGGRMRPR